MRELSPTLLTAQKEASRTPYVRVTARNRLAGIVRLNWTRLYTGSEPDYFHALAVPGDGSLIRVRISPPTDGRKLYRQRVADPGPESDFSQWLYAGQYNVIIVAAGSLGSEASIFWIKNDRSIYQLESRDCGASWGSPQLIDYSPTTAINGIAVSYRPNGDIGLFFADQDVLYAKQRQSGIWQDKVAWDKTTGELSGVAACYDGDFNLFVTGQDTEGNFKLYSLIYGDGQKVPAGTWSALKEFARAPADGQFEYRQAFMAKPDVHRCFFVEKFGGSEAYARPFWSHSVADTNFGDNLWHEPVPFDLASEYGLAIAHHGDYGWLSHPGGVWRAKLAEESLDLSADLLNAKQEAGEEAGRLTVELENSHGQYATPGAGELSALDIGCQLEFSPGYVTPAGSEASPGPAYWITTQEHASAHGKASLILQALDGWELLKNWRARHQLRWNKAASEMSVKDILAFVLARCGLKLEVKSQSPALDSYYPDFVINPNSTGEAVVKRLLSFVPDVIFIEGAKAYLVNPTAEDSPVYAYGADHAIIEGRYRKGAWEFNRVLVEGCEPVSEEPLISDVFAWAEVARLYDRPKRLEDGNIASISQAEQRAAAYLRRAEIEAGGGTVRIPPNCGQQLYDVITLNDPRLGLGGEKRRVLGLTLTYNPLRGEYEARLLLGAV
ncbi:MAG: hypothetical protein JW790_04830 [Dehalococcoidales bacterium]|nr:hypothetical protein [Dehalococcoidales bacterium]